MSDKISEGQTAPLAKPFERIGPTHAHGLDHLAGLNSSIRQGDVAADIRLDFELSCGIAPIRISGNNFEIALRSCFISLHRVNCEIHVGSGYEHWLGTGSFKATETQTNTSEKTGHISAGINAELDAAKGSGGLAAKFGLGAARKSGAQSEAKSEQDIRVGLIVMSGQDRWRVGDVARGDARRSDGILNGAYFREERPKDGDPPPLCRLAMIDVDQTMQLSLSVTASFGSLIVLKHDGAQTRDEEILQGAHTTLKRRSSRASQDHQESLRAHVAGMVAAKAIHHAQIKAGIKAPENEFLIAQETLLVTGGLKNEN